MAQGEIGQSEEKRSRGVPGVAVAYQALPEYIADKSMANGNFNKTDFFSGLNPLSTLNVARPLLEKVHVKQTSKIADLYY